MAFSPSQVRALEGRKGLRDHLDLHAVADTGSALKSTTGKVTKGVGDGFSKVAGLLTPAQLKKKEAIESEQKVSVTNGSPHYLGVICGGKGCTGRPANTLV